MGVEVTITTEGQLRLDQSILDHLGVQPGGRLEVILKPDSRVELYRSSKKPVLADLHGVLARENAKPVSLEEMQMAIEDVQF
jgi:bifunctional DNA-binding transcriptional regulator/antitoxin component of YhaV-PrlF toxin-antitoxin module